MKGDRDGATGFREQAQQPLREGIYASSKTERFIMVAAIAIALAKEDQEQDQRGSTDSKESS